MITFSTRFPFTKLPLSNKLSEVLQKEKILHENMHSYSIDVITDKKVFLTQKRLLTSAEVAKLDTLVGWNKEIARRESDKRKVIEDAKKEKEKVLRQEKAAKRIAEEIKQVEADRLNAMKELKAETVRKESIDVMKKGETTILKGKAELKIHK